MFWEKPPRGTRNGISAANYFDWAQQSPVLRGDGRDDGRDHELFADHRERLVGRR